jgi:transcriptional regulator with XRE-family HTH domain
MIPGQRDGSAASSASFAAVLRASRMRAGLTQCELASRAGVGVRTLRELERARVARPQQGTVELLADAFGLTGQARASFIAMVRQKDR